MTSIELKYMNQIIRTQTLQFCRGSIPSMDEIGDLSIMVAMKTRGLLVKPNLVNLKKWVDVVGNTIMKIIATEVA